VPGPPQASTQGGGRLAPAVIQRIVRQNFGSFRKCYEQALARDPRAAGRVAVHFVIERSGQVSHAEVAPSLDADAPPLNDARAVACIVDGFSKLVFPRPEEGIVTVVYPVNFSPGD
jgi:outer membrane biosynthesis protein TonB